MKLSIVITEPTESNEGGTGGFEWRTDPTAAEREFRSMRARGQVTRIWHGVDMGDMTPDQISEAVDAVYWDGAAHNWGEPARVHGSN